MNLLIPLGVVDCTTLLPFEGDVCESPWNWRWLIVKVEIIFFFCCCLLSWRVQGEEQEGMAETREEISMGEGEGCQ